MVILSEVSETFSSSNDHHHYLYDVFLSFRGADTRLSFTNHLHQALVGANLETFLDDEEIETGLYLKPELGIAIKRSRASVIVLSENYATSTWCLDELVLILDQHNNFNQIVIPIFYHVEPTDVRKQKNSFGDAMEKHKQRMDAEKDGEKKSLLADKIVIWKEALTQVADLKGKDAKNRLETEFIEEIVKDLSKRIRVPIMSNLPLLIGRYRTIEFVTSWLKDESSPTVDILTLYGIGGIGKTSLAKYVYQLHFHEFNRSCFIEDISRRCADFNGLLDVQKQLCDSISNASSIHIYDVSAYTSVIENAVARKKVLLVLDDIDCLGQLDALLGTKRFHPGSKIIITTRDASVTERCALFNPHVLPKHQKQLLNGLYAIPSRKLLCLHAFKCEKVQEGYEEVFDNIVNYCEGHPLALQVLGRYLHNRDVAYWVDSIEELKKGPLEPVSVINNVLRLSFDKLSHNDKELFKHIACFFVGIDREYSETILDACKIKTSSGITSLTDRCLLHIGRNNEFTMHSLIQEMGRDTVHQESPNKPEERSRLWCRKDSFKVLNKNRGTGNTKGLTFDMRLSEKGKSCGSLFEVETEALSKMHKLMLLQLNNIQLNGSYEYFPKKLRWLCMQWFPLESLPSDLPMKKLVALDLSYSNIKSFDMSCINPRRPKKRQKSTGCCSKDTRLLGSLKILDVSFCKQLHNLGGFFELPTLVKLLARCCIGLIEICESIEQCVELVFIDLSDCNKLKKLPSLGRLKKVKTLLLDGCEFDESETETRDMDSLEIQTSSSSIVTAIPREIKSLAVSFPSSLVRLSLMYNNLSSESFPEDWSWLSMLEDLHLDGNPIISLPICVRTLSRLKTLSMCNCKKLTSIRHPPRTLTKLFSVSSSLRKVVFDPEMSSLQLCLAGDLLATSRIEFDGILKIQPMADVDKCILHSLGWSNLELTKERSIKPYRHDEPDVHEIQMYYEFGIFSTFYGGEEMPSWITQRSMGNSISFTIPLSPKTLRGLNFCYQTWKLACWLPYYRLPEIKISNITKKRTWVYNHYVNYVYVSGEWLTYTSHWMFGMTDMEPDDHVTINIEQQQEECVCGVSFVYDDGNVEEETKEDVLGYYKSWNHIIGGDLSPCQLTTGEYSLNFRDFDPLYYLVSKKDAYFKAFSARKSFKHVQAIEDVTKY